MHLAYGRHLAYCTNALRGEGWAETFETLRTQVLEVKRLVCPEGEAFAIGLRLGDLASRELAGDRVKRDEFRRWLEGNGCYVFTINGFPYGRFHGGRVKEQVYVPDWTTRERVEYTVRLCELLAEWLPVGVAGSVSTVPGSFKGFADVDEDRMLRNLRTCGERVARIGERAGRTLSLALEPEPLCWIENTAETVRFFERLGGGLPIGVCFDACHFAVEFEGVRGALEALTAAGVPICKLHLSSALTLRPTAGALKALRGFADPVYLHQVVVRGGEGGRLRRFRDLDEALGREDALELGEEWRVHYHVPLHAPPVMGELGTTGEELVGALDWLKGYPGVCPHLEMETYTWEVLPPEWRAARVEEQIAKEYAWTLARLRERGLA